jgi:DNA-binding protein HU-beta
MAEKKQNPAMNRAALSELVAKDLEESKAGADRAIAAVLSGIQRGLKKNKKVSLVGFGTFEVKKRKARKGRNPQTGEEIKIKASKSVGFRAGKPLKEFI